MNQIFLGEPSEYIKNWFIQTFPSWPTYTTLNFVDGTSQTKEINGIATWKNIGVKSSFRVSNNTLAYCQLGINVTEISSYTFHSYYSLTSVTIPNSVTLIGNYAFDDCSSLISVSIPNSVTSIKEGVFQGCSSLTSITIPNSVSSIGIGTFLGCSSLTSINIPSSVTSIGNYAFCECRSLPSITIPNSVTSIGNNVFAGCSSLTLVIFECKTMSDITSMANYPWDIPNTSVIKPGIS